MCWNSASSLLELTCLFMWYFYDSASVEKKYLTTNSGGWCRIQDLNLHATIALRLKRSVSANFTNPAYVEIGGLHIAKRINARKHVVNPKR